MRESRRSGSIDYKTRIFIHHIVSRFSPPLLASYSLSTRPPLPSPLSVRLSLCTYTKKKKNSRIHSQIVYLSILPLLLPPPPPPPYLKARWWGSRAVTSRTRTREPGRNKKTRNSSTTSASTGKAVGLRCPGVQVHATAAGAGHLRKISLKLEQIKIA